jgi:hypothetical protein
MAEIRLLRADEIETRVQSIIKTSKGVGAILLLYKDARVDMKILDEAYGVNNWQRTHEVINGNLFCNIDIWDPEKKAWVRKQDVGVESNAEKEKGQASDAFKRAGFNVGIGRELYTAPLIWINLADDEYTSEKSGNREVYKLKANVKFTVADIKYDEERVINYVAITDKGGNLRYKFDKTLRGTFKTSEVPEKAPLKSPTPPKPAPAAPTDPAASAAPQEVCSVCNGPISSAEINYSLTKYGQQACRACQKTLK